jgi:glyoxylase-like metal-dependent hydrolase (beta-lactamase superfamily II)
MRVHHLSCGTLCPIGGRLTDGLPGLLRTARLVCHCLLVETEGGLVLVDTGLGTREVGRPVPRLSPVLVNLARPRLSFEETAVRQLRRLGFDPADVRHIVLTHLDFDHAGGLADFPWAQVHVLAEERRAAMRPRTFLARRRYRSAQWAHGVRWQLYEPGGEPWLGFSAVRELAGLPPEILLVPLTGHTQGHAGVAVRTGGGWLLHAGDAYLHRGEVHGDRYRCPPALRTFQAIAEVNRAARLRNQRRLRALAQDAVAKVVVFSAHDPVELRVFAERAGAPAGEASPRS